MAISGSISEVGDIVNFTYSGGVQTYTIPYNGLYLLTVAGGGTKNVKGGLAKGYKVLNKGTVIYICVGQAGQQTSSSDSACAGGYNGGGKGYTTGGAAYGGQGGAGATHMALVTGTLAGIGYTTFVTNKKGLVVAGGAGGFACVNGGYGGGNTGGTGYAASEYDAYNLYGTGGTQTSGGVMHRYETTAGCTGTFGQGASTTGNSYRGGGGGGFYGGGGGSSQCGGGGGSGWIGGVPTVTYKNKSYSPTNTAGGATSANANGYASIQFVVKAFPTLKYNDTILDGLTYNGTSIDTIIYNGTTLS